MTQNEELNGEIRLKIQNARTILIVSHVRPDGDAVGSLLALGLALQDVGKEVTMVLSDGVPTSFRQLPGANQVLRKTPMKPFDLAIVVDCSDLLRTGTALGGCAPDINIDHHITNLNFARTNLVCPDAQATCGILAENLEDWGLRVSEKIAKALLTGLVTDTIGFRTSNVNADTLRLAAWLMDHGANLADLYNRAIVRRSFEAALYWGQGLSHIKRSGRIVWTTLSLKDREIASYNGNDDADLVNVISAIDESDIGLIFVEQQNHHVKVSWRAQPGWDVSKIALKFGGGGHPAAAGADIPGTMEDVQSRVLDATRQVISAGENGKNEQLVKENKFNTSG
jgi:phosphoesterase RecJ-like protein